VFRKILSIRRGAGIGTDIVEAVGSGPAQPTEHQTMASGQGRDGWVLAVERPKRLDGNNNNPKQE